MKKITITLVALATIGIIGIINKDLIHEKYLQTQINKNLTVKSGIVSFCGHSFEENETPQQLISRVGIEFNGPQTYREIVTSANETLKDTDEIKALNNKLDHLGWQSDEYLNEKISEYKNLSYMKEELENLLAIKKIRDSVDYTKQGVKTARDALRDKLYLSRKDELDQNISKIVNQMACELNDDSLKDETNLILAPLDKTQTVEEKKKIEILSKQREQQAIQNAVKPLEAFTKKFYQFINDVVAEVKIIDSSTVTEETTITNTLTVVSTNAFGKKQRFEVGCVANAVEINPVFGSASISKCFLHKAGKDYGKSIYLYKLKMLVEEYNDEAQWSKVKKLLLERFN